ncbi:MAG: GDP-mannose 4,6-dehydratase [Candidatus Saccharibacteria bacterium]
MEKERIAISGVNGFVGHHLAQELNNAGISVIGIGQEQAASPNLSGLVDEYHQADLIEAWPDIAGVKAVIHLAGLAAVGPSFDKPQIYINANSSMVTNLCEYYAKKDKKPRIVLVSSGAIYSPDQQMPINEAGELGLTSPYAVSKVLNENQATYYRNRGLDCVVVRPFNHIGPGQNTGFILPDFYDRLSNLADGETSITTGNIETRRDYTDVRDIVRAYGKVALADTLKFDTYNICSGRSLSGSEILTELKTAMNMPDVSFTIDPTLVRPTDPQEIIGDSSRIKNELGWMPEIDIHQTVTDFVKSKSS